MTGPSFAVKQDEPARAPVYVQAGQVILFREAAEAVAIVGTCVATCIWDPYRGLAVMNHFLLPTHTGVGTESARHGSRAMAEAYEQLLAAGALPHRLRARVFGGAAIGIGVGDVENHLGTRNHRLALRALQEKAIPVIGREVGGTKSRKVIFRTATGEAEVSTIG